MAERIAALQVHLGFDASEFADGVGDAQRTFSRFARELSDQFRNLERAVRRVGIGLTAGISAPFAALTVVSTRTAASFEAAMNRVEAAMRGISADQFQRLSEAARTLGPEVGLSAIEAAAGIETLALTGMSAESILRGGLAATLRLSAANLGEVGDSAALVSDIMRQFTMTTRDLPTVVNQVTGALDASKLTFQDYQQAIAQAGGVAGSAGVEFADFNAALAATAPLFQSGSDAGTSFKTFITSLTPQSEDAAHVMRTLGLEFFDATGRLKSMAEVAEELQTALGGLSERSRTQGLRTMFGTDAMRTAVGLMQQGREGIESLQAAIDRTDAGEKLAIQMRGAEAATNRLSAAFERVKIALGSAGLLTAFTAVSGALAAVASSFANLPPAIHTMILVIAGLAAAIGPLTLIILGIARVALPLFIGRLGLLGIALTALINPIGAMAGLFLNLAVRFTGAASALSLFATSLARVLGPLGLAISALTLLYLMYGRTTEASERLQQSTEAARGVLAAQQEQMLALAAATGEARRALIEKMRADRAAAAQALRTAVADLMAARATLIRARATAQLNRERMRVAANDPRLMVGAGQTISRQITDRAEADMRESLTAVRTLTQAVQGFNTTLASATAGAAVDVNLERPGRTPRGRQARDTADEEARNEHQFQSELRRLRQDTLRAQQDQTTDAVVRADLDNQILDIERQQYAADQELAVKLGDINRAKAAQLLVAYDIADEERRQSIELGRTRQIAEEDREIRAASHEIAEQALRHEVDLADTAAERRDAETRLLELTYRYERARLEAIMLQEGANRVAVEDARLRLAALENWRANEQRLLNLRTQGPLESFLDRLPSTAARAREALESVAVDGLRSIEDGLIAVLDGTKSLSAAFRDMASSIIADLLRIQIRRAMADLLGSVLNIGAAVAGGGSGFNPASAVAAFASASGRLPGLAGGGIIRVGGPPGIDRSVLSLNGMAVARVDRGEDISVGRGRLSRDRVMGDLHIHMSGVMSQRQARETGSQLARATQREIARAAKVGMA